MSQARPPRLACPPEFAEARQPVCSWQGGGRRGPPFVVGRRALGQVWQRHGCARLSPISTISTISPIYSRPRPVPSTRRSAAACCGSCMLHRLSGVVCVRTAAESSSTTGQRQSPSTVLLSSSTCESRTQVRSCCCPTTLLPERTLCHTVCHIVRASVHTSLPSESVGPSATWPRTGGCRCRAAQVCVSLR
jgi:hypothetical protein